MADRIRRIWDVTWLSTERAILTVLHLRTLLRLWYAPTGTSLRAHSKWRSELWRLVQVPFVHAEWSTHTRYHRVIEHFSVVDQLGPPFSLNPGQYALLIDIPELGSAYRLTLDQPHWFFRDGLLTFSIWEGDDRLFSIVFLLARCDERLIAIVGGVQGRRGENSLERYREVSRRAEGMRLRDLMIDLFRGICRGIDVQTILGISDEARYQQASYYTRRSDFVPAVSLDYDAMWRERGGVLRDDGFFDVPVNPPPRAPDTIPARKRSLYRRRAELLSSIHTRLSASLRHPKTISIRQHYQD